MNSHTGEFIALAPDTDTPLAGIDPVFQLAAVIRDQDGFLFVIVGTKTLDVPYDGEKFDAVLAEARNLQHGMSAFVNPGPIGVSIDFWIPLNEDATADDARAAVARSGAASFARKYARTS